MIRPPPRSTRPNTPFPYTTPCRSLVHILGGDPPPGADDSDGDYLVGVGADLGFGNSPFRFRLAADTISFDSTRLTAGVLYARSEEHTSELQSLMRISYAVFCLKKKK